MANSKITITFNSLANINDVLNFKETSRSLNFDETFKKNRLGLKEVSIPAFNLGLYEITYNEMANTSNIGVAYNDGVFKTVPIDALMSEDNNGMRTASVYSVFTPNVVDLNTHEAIVWGEGSFVHVEDTYTGFLSTNFRSAFNLDYNASNFFTVTALPGAVGSGLGTVVIEANYPNAVFVSGPTTADVTFLIENVVAELLIIEDLNFSESTTNPKCSHYRINVRTDKIARKITLNNVVLTNSNTSNPYSFEIPRGQQWSLILEDANGNIASRNSSVVPINLNEGIFNFQSNYLPNGGTITIVPIVDTSSLNLQYSLDNSTWQNSNVFSGIIAGSYTVFVRDQYGCQFSKNIDIDESGNEREPYCLVSKSNAIQFAERVIWDNCAIFKNDENTLSCEADVRHPYKEIQQFNNCDAITTQIKSNYVEVLAAVVTQNSEVPLLVDKMTNNMNLKDSRDARMYSLGNGLTGIYFITGNVYDFDTGANTGEFYVLNGALPSWAKINTYVRVNDNWFMITNIDFDEVLNADVLIIESNYTGQDVSVRASSIYNLFNYEVYEFSILMSSFLNDNFQIRINNNDPSFPSVEYLSEVIDVKMEQRNTIAIKYKNSTNTDIFYATGIENLLRLPINRINGKLFDESETYTTDTTTILLNSELHEMNEFEFEPVTKQMMWKLTQALSHDIVTIDGIGYVKNTNIEVDGPLDRSNLYIVKAVMIRTGNTFNGRTSSGNVSQIPTNQDIPALIDSGNGYVIYR